MYARALDMLHNSWDKHIGAVGNNVHFKFFARHILIDKHRIIYSLSKYALHINPNLVLVVDNLHILSAYYIGRAQQHRKSEFLRGFKRFFECIYTKTLRALYTEFLKQLVKSLELVSARVLDSVVRASQLASAAARMQNAGNSYTWGSHLANNFADGIRAGLGWVSSAASAIANAARSVLGFSVPEEGPWSGSEKGGETSGLHLAQNFASGMTKGVGLVEDAAGKLGEASYFEANGASHAGGSIRSVSYEPERRSGGSKQLEEKVDRVIALLEAIASQDRNVYMDGRKVSSALYASARTQMVGRGTS